MTEVADRLKQQQSAAAKAREALAAARANGSIKKRKQRKEPRTTFTLSDAGELHISDGKHQWPMTAEDTARLKAFLCRLAEPADGAAIAGKLDDILDELRRGTVIRA